MHLRLKFAALLIAVALSPPAFAQQQPSPEEVVRALNMKVAQLQNNLNDVLLALAQAQTQLKQAESDLQYLRENYALKDPAAKP